MILSLMFRRTAAALLVVALGFAALPGCGNSTPSKAETKEEPKQDPKPDPKKGDPVTDPKGGTQTPYIEPKSMLGKVEDPADKMGQAFLKDLGQGTANADALSTGFLKSVGKPLELPDDIKNGVSRDAATRWLKKVGEHYTFSLALDRQQAGDAVYWLGQVNGRTLPPIGGTYAMRLVKEAGAWKVDSLVLTSLESKGRIPDGSADAAFQEFAVTSFVEALTDLSAMADETRPATLAHAMTPELRKAWAAPGKQDQDQGYDYSPGNLRLTAVKYGGGTSAFSVSKVGATSEFKVELTKPAGQKALVVKLVKGTAPGEWLVSEVTEAKG